MLSISGHIHNDQTGNAHYFKAAKLIMQEKEYDVAFNSNKRPFNYENYKNLENLEVIKLNGDYELFGDGTVQFKLEETGAILISGDIAYYEVNYKKMEFARRTANRVPNSGYIRSVLF